MNSINFTCHLPSSNALNVMKFSNLKEMFSINLTKKCIATIKVECKSYPCVYNPDEEEASSLTSEKLYQKAKKEEGNDWNKQAAWYIWVVRDLDMKFLHIFNFHALFLFILVVVADWISRSFLLVYYFDDENRQKIKFQTVWSSKLASNDSQTKFFISIFRQLLQSCLNPHSVCILSQVVRQEMLHPQSLSLQ